jgi:hypothetical protein
MRESIIASVSTASADESFWTFFHEALTGVLGTLVTQQEQELIEMVRQETDGETIRFTKAGVKALVDKSK